MIRECRWIIDGYLHPRTPADMTLKVADWLDAVAAVLHGIRH